MGPFTRSLALTAGLATGLVDALTLETTSATSITDNAKTVAHGLMVYYSGNDTGGTPGILPSPYYWWEAGAMFGHMVDYWYYTGDTTYNSETNTAIVYQAGGSGDFMPSNQTLDEGNDDQVFWAFTAMEAAELNFPAPNSGTLSWVAMAQAVFNVQAARWDNSTCGGGLRWQIFPTNSGYDYKNVASNGGFFQLASRLARYTGNDTYTEWAETAWSWFETSVLYDAATYQIYDGTSDLENCTSADHTQWSYNYGMYLTGLAYLYNHTSDDSWLTPLEGILNSTLTNFFPASMGDKIMVEVACEPLGNCDTDNYTFKSFTMRWLAVVSQLVPQLADTIWPYIEASGAGAAGQCDGGTDGVTCGFEWNTTTWDGLYGVGEQMSALAAIQANMLNVDDTLAAPYTSSNGGTSVSDPSAGTGSSDSSSDEPSIDTRTITTADKAGAAIATVVVLVFTVAGAWFLITGT